MELPRRPRNEDEWWGLQEQLVAFYRERGLRYAPQHCPFHRNHASHDPFGDDGTTPAGPSDILDAELYYGELPAQGQPTHAKGASNSTNVTCARSLPAQRIP